MQYYNAYKPPPHPSSTPITPQSELHENTSPSTYDLNSFLPIPKTPLETEKLRLEPLIPTLHGEALSKAFMAPSEDPEEVWFYPFPSGRPYEKRVEVFMYLEKQRRRANLLSFAAMDKVSGQMAGILSLGCDPTQATLDVKLIGVKIFPEFRGTHIFKHAGYLLLSYVLDPVIDGGLGLVRVGWRTPPENERSQKAAEKLGLSREGIMKCYEVSNRVPGSPFPNFTTVMDGTDRVTEDAVVYSMTVHEWLSGGRDRLRKLL